MLEVSNKFSLKAPKTNPELNGVSLHSITDKTEYLRVHFGKIEAIYDDESKELLQKDRAEQENTKFDGDDSRYNYSHSESLKEIQHVYLRMHRYSAILAAYSYLEASMVRTCQKVPERPGKPEYPKAGIVSCYKYLKESAGANFSSINSLWQELRTLESLRNCIIHSNGDVRNTNRPTWFTKIVHTTSGLNFIEENMVMISKEYILSAISNIEGFLKHILSELDNDGI